MSRLITSAETGRILGGTKPISIRTLAYWRKHGVGPEYVRIGRAYRYDEDALYRYLEQHKNV